MTVRTKKALKMLGAAVAYWLVMTLSLLGPAAILGLLARPMLRLFNPVRHGGPFDLARYLVISSVSTAVAVAILMGFGVFRIAVRTMLSDEES